MLPAEARRIIIWRHGRTVWNAEHRFQGQRDIPLDAVGITQAEQAAVLLAHLKPDRILTSDLERAKVTATKLATKLNLQVITDKRLRETFAGEWEGLTKVQIDEKYPDMVARWAVDSTMQAGISGEDRITVATRANEVIQEHLRTLHIAQTMVVVTHGGTARAIIGQLLELPHEHWVVLGVLNNTAWSVLIENHTNYGPKWRLQEYNAGTLPEPALAEDQ